ncbi:Uncharacterised protein [Segatella copri]|nr:Uncharacterised protein [Segatella copri]
MNVILAPGAASTEKLPSMSVIPTALPLTVMVAPMIGSPEASFTCPLTAFVCAKELTVRSRPLARVNALRGNLIFTCFIICLIFKLMNYIYLSTFSSFLLGLSCCRSYSKCRSGSFRGLSGILLLIL